jgi:hypothetical protein
MLCAYDPGVGREKRPLLLVDESLIEAELVAGYFL